MLLCLVGWLTVVAVAWWARTFVARLTVVVVAGLTAVAMLVAALRRVVGLAVFLIFGVATASVLLTAVGGGGSAAIVGQSAQLALKLGIARLLLQSTGAHQLHLEVLHAFGILLSAIHLDNLLDVLGLEGNRKSVWGVAEVKST